ncbi:PREDICTED: prostate stem cell antigen-like [Acropora digitifera]|uniref:prostate stem cell antigen-like n=1 Tax=Acropora digitifera TaxID=70779 RepID=UPI00077AF77C|nr:PREDICTED: prostate stem cell antigen-like [Acropora digitifera]
MKTVLFSAFILCTASVGIAIKCLTCSSPTSMEDCEKIEKEHDCGDKFDRCGKLSTYRNETPNVFSKGCSTKSDCAKQSEGCNLSLICKSDCCDSDGCNSSVPDRCNNSVIIAFLMVTYALVSKMCY